MPRDDREDQAAPEAVSAALRALLDHVVDYAGLFPPASLDVPVAVRNYAAYRAGADRWMLGRFVAGVARLPELRATIRSIKPVERVWPLTVVAPDAPAATAVLRGPDDALLAVESVEVRARVPADIALVGRASDRKREVYVEVALDDSLDAMLDAIAVAKLRAKVRTGGVTPEAFPSAAALVRFMRGCLDRDLPFKATAGLHHPLRGSYRLTYDGRAPQGEMFGFLNVFLAATLMRAGLGDDDARTLLEESDPATIAIDDQSIGWRAHTVDVAAITAARAGLATSFGSCSFREPVDELPFPVEAA
jgi:hypothetical protein